MQRFLNRRQLMKSGAIAASLATLSSRSVTAWAESPLDLIVGMATMGFYSYTNEQLARELAAENVKTIQLFLTQKDSNFWKYNGRSDVSAMTPERCREIADTYRSAGVGIHSIGVYTNLIHPDPARNTTRVRVTALLRLGSHCWRIGRAMACWR